MLKRFTKGLAITLSLILCFGSFEMQTQAAGISSIFPGSGISVVLSEGVEESGMEQVVSPKVAESEEIEESEEEENPENLVISIAKDYINVRETAAQKGKVVGKFYKNAAGTILSEQDGWYEIKSGNVTGFVKADLCATGEEALALAEEVGTRMAKVKSERLLVREEADSEAAVIGMVVGEDELMVLEETDEWVKVDIEEGYGWVSREFVKVYTDFIRAETKEEEMCDVIFEDCDVIHVTSVALDCANVDYADIHDVVYRNCRVELDDIIPQPILQQSDDDTYVPTDPDYMPSSIAVTVTYHFETIQLVLNPYKFFS